MAVTDLKSLYLHTLKDIYYAEKQVLKALPKMAKKADSPRLRSNFEEHLAQTKTQVQRLEQVFELLGERARGKKCVAIEGIIEEAKEQMDEIDDANTRDAAMIAAAQAVEHYEITRYGTLVSWGKLLGMPEASKILEKTLKEEWDTDAKLTKLAEGRLNKEAA